LSVEVREKEDVARRAAEAIMLAVGGHVLGDFAPRLVRMTTGFAGGVGESMQEKSGAT
jgi:hypothetical protein